MNVDAISHGAGRLLGRHRTMIASRKRRRPRAACISLPLRRPQTMVAAVLDAEGTVFGRPAALTRSAVRWRHSVVVLDALSLRVMAPKCFTHHVTFVCGNVFRRRESTQNTLAHSIMLRLSSSLDLRQTLDSFGSTHDHILFLKLFLSMLHFTLPRVG